jgi:hypothetical protein
MRPIVRTQRHDGPTVDPDGVLPTGKSDGARVERDVTGNLVDGAASRE